MALSDFILSLREDLSDPDAGLFTDEVLGRCILKGVYQAARDLEVSMAISNGEITPEPEGETLEMLLLLGRIHACQAMRAATANAFSFSSADKRVDKTKQPEHWAQLEEDLRAYYKARLGEIKPGSTVSPDDYVITPKGLSPLIYERGKDNEPLV